MANKYSWDAAKEANYDVGDYSGIAGNIVPMTRRTIADGKLLNDYYVQDFVGKDNYLLDSLNGIDEKVNDINFAIDKYADTEWDVSKVSGFNTITTVSNNGNQTIIMPKQAAGTLRLVSIDPAIKLSATTVNYKRRYLRHCHVRYGFESNFFILFVGNKQWIRSMDYCIW